MATNVNRIVINNEPHIRCSGAGAVILL